MRVRDYAYEALTEVTGSDPEVGRGQINAALRDIRAQEPELASVENSYLLSAEIHERAKMYRSVFENAALTPTALAKHWKRVREETHRRPRVPEYVPSPPPTSTMREHNLQEVLALREKMGWR